MDMNEETIVGTKTKQKYMLPLEDRIAYSVQEASQLVGVSVQPRCGARSREEICTLLREWGSCGFQRKSCRDLLKIRWRFHLNRKGATDNRIACE